MTNAIATAQEYYTKYGATYLTHSKFKKQDRVVKLSQVLEKFGKSTKGVEKMENVCCAHDLKAGHDVSFRKGILSADSAETYIQEIGRIVRWGEYESGEVVIAHPFTRADSSVISLLSNTGLYHKFREEK